jgi:hypothetical protein
MHLAATLLYMHTATVLVQLPSVAALTSLLLPSLVHTRYSKR